MYNDDLWGGFNPSQPMKPHETPQQPMKMGWRERFKQRFDEMQNSNSRRGRLAGMIGDVGQLFGQPSVPSYAPSPNYGIMDQYRPWQSPDILPRQY